jgi:hypothetical protein
VMTAVDVWWQHFMNLRDHYMAQDEVQEAASLFTAVYTMSEPDILAEGDWHLPFVTEAERYKWPEDMLLMLSLGRCARTSYASDHAAMLQLAGQREIHEEMQFARRLLVMKPEHAGPKEHQAAAHVDPDHRSGTLHGWDQLRHHPASTMLLMAACAVTPIQ